MPAREACVTAVRQLRSKMSFKLEKVLISDEISQKCVDILKNNGINVDKITNLSKEELIQKIPEYDGLIVRSATKVTADVIQAASRLKIIGRAGTGVDNIDTPAATKKGVIVMNTPGGNTTSAAEHTCALLMAMSRHISAGTESLHAGRWDRKKFMGNEVDGKTLAIIGLGRIGQCVATRMQAFGMRTIGFDPIIPGEVSATFGVEWMPLEQLWPQADYITVHTPLIPQTKHLINEKVFGICKKGVRVINCARGGIIDEDALLKALQSGQCGGAGLDVFVQEPPTNTNLINHPLVTCTPHLGASTHEAQVRVAEEIAQQFVDLSQGTKLFGAINAQALTCALSPDTQPWVKLGSCLGSMAAAITGQVKGQAQLEVVTQGDYLKKAGSYMTAATLMGALKSQEANGLNMISAPAYAKDLGVQVKSEHKEGDETMVTLAVKQADGQYFSVSGHANGGSPVITALNGAKFTLGVAPSSNMVVYRSQANPQVLPAVLGALAAAGTAIQGCSISEGANGEAWTAVSIAKPLKDVEVLKLHVNSIHQVSL